MPLLPDLIATVCVFRGVLLLSGNSLETIFRLSGTELIKFTFQSGDGGRSTIWWLVRDLNTAFPDVLSIWKGSDGQTGPMRDAESASESSSRCFLSSELPILSA